MKSWNNYMFELAQHIATKSKDPSRQVGCVIMGPDYEIRTTGFNGFPRGVRETSLVPQQPHFSEEYEYNITTQEVAVRCTCGLVVQVKAAVWDAGDTHPHFTGEAPPSEEVLSNRWERPAKYQWVEHAERNAIYNAARMGIPLKGCTAYITLAPCADCTRALIQAGISAVYGPAFPEGEEYKDYGFDKSIIMLRETDTAYRVIDSANQDTT
jgi:dCMP deaminase